MENKIVQLFKENKVNVSQMSKSLDIAYGTLYDIAKGNTPFEKIGIVNFIKIASAFGMTADELYGETDTPSEKFELNEIFDNLNSVGRKALLASARGIHDEFQNELFDILCQDKYENGL